MGIGEGFGERRREEGWVVDVLGLCCFCIYFKTETGQYEGQVLGFYNVCNLNMATLLFS